MSDYPLTWVTGHLAVGHAPMSYIELDSLKAQGIDAIVNLCGEYTDLHEIEQSAGFEVFFLPVEDENAPAMAAMEAGLDWLDEAMYLGKKVLVHCRHGIGRTGTFVTAYLLRRGFTMRQAARILKPTRANPTNFPQWWLLRKFGKKEGRLTLREPTPENRKPDDLEPFFQRYEALLALIDSANGTSDATCCGAESCSGTDCGSDCSGQVELELIEALYLHTRANVTLSTEKRKELIDRATVAAQSDQVGDAPQEQTEETPQPRTKSACPLFAGAACLLHRFRPVSCRLQNINLSEGAKEQLQHDLGQLSREIFAAAFGQTIDQTPPPVQLPDVVTGRFIQNYFRYLALNGRPGNPP